MNKQDDFSYDFLQGQRDCKDGKPHEDGKSDAYDRGYSTQYQHEQNMDALSAGKQGYL